MDGRWVLLMLAVAVVAAVRLRRRAPDDEAPPVHREATEQPADDRPGPPADQTWTASPPARSGFGASSRSPADDELGHELDPELGAALDRVWAEHADDAGTLLDARLRQLVRRGVPARAIRRAPGGRAVRVVFADGTVVLCRGTGRGDFGRLGMALLHHSVRLGGYAHHVDGTRLEFRWNPDQRLAAVAVGLDQPD